MMADSKHVPADPSLLERNLCALSRSSPMAAQAVAQAQPHPDAVFEPTADGVPTCRLPVDGRMRALASARHPLREADRLAEQADPSQAAIFAVLGFGLGYHVDAMVHRLHGRGLVLCYEPDVRLLRSVLERVDCTACLQSDRLIVLHDVSSSEAISARLKGLEGVLALGVRFIAHPPSVGRLGHAADRFSRRLVEVVAAAKTSIVTVLVQTEKTIENTVRNARTYAACAGVNDLQGALRGVPAVVVSAGPSLAESLDVLARPQTRQRACIIAAQTVLRPLLARGIRPHFVTALDHHDISTRFYEGLSAEMVRGVTLVVEPKANPAIVAAWPGAIRVVGDEVLDRLLGLQEHARLRAGTTVAHLSYYLARALGCDPVVLVGQDLAYTDMLYYGPGAAIHDVWAAELDEMRTLEMMELERIGRARRMHRQAEDAHGRPVLTDEQMHTYRLQFERDFAQDQREGLTTIDAGRGAAKAHTVAMPLDEALERYGRAFELPATPPPKPREAMVAESMRSVAEQARTLASLSRKARQMVLDLDPFGDAQAMNERVRAIHAIRDQAEALDPAYWLTQFLNQTGGLRRAKRDRAIALAAEQADEREVQAQRIERDAENLQWLAEAADRLAELLDDAAQRPKGQADAPRPASQGRAPSRPEVCVPGDERLPAVVWFDPSRGGLGQRRDLLSPAAGGVGPVELTLRALQRCRRVQEVVLVTPDPAAAQALIDRVGGGLPMRTWPATAGLEERARAIGAARALGPASFRGGLASLTVADEAFDPQATLGVMDELGAAAVLVLGADWALLDAALTDRVAEALLLDPQARHVAFAQAPAGLSATALARPAVSEIADNPSAGPIATIGGLLGYAPHAPRPDPIARDVCVRVEPALRDLGLRLIPDSPDRLASLAPALRRAADGQDPSLEVLQECAKAPQRPTHLRVELADGRDTDLHQRTLAFVRGACDSAVTLDCSAEGFTPGAQALAQALAEARAACVHVRTGLLGGQEEIDRLLASPLDAISVDVPDPDFPPPLEALPEMVGTGLARPWVVPRLWRTEAMLPVLLEQYDQALLRFGSALVHAEPGATGVRLGPLPLPVSAQRRLDRQTRQTREGAAGAKADPADRHAASPAPGALA